MVGRGRTSGRAAAPPHVHKFGGASLATPDAMLRAARLLRARRPEPMVVVVSALAGVTDALMAAAVAAARGAAPTRAVAALRVRHRDTARRLTRPGRRRAALLALMTRELDDLAVLLAGLTGVRELTPRTADVIVARGERLSAHCFVAALAALRVPAAYVDPLEVVKTDGTFGQASPDVPRTERAARRALQPLLGAGVVPVVPGFTGAAPDGQITTLGRGGSDLTATLLGRVLGSAAVSLWKDVPGILTGDPRVVPDARVVPQLHVREAAELAYYGAKVLHPRALIPLGRRNLAVHIRPFADPAAPGTEVSRRRTLTAYPVKALSAIPAQALLTVAGNGMLGVPGIAARTFAAMQHAGISVSLITQASSEHSICFSVPEPHAERARAALRVTFRREIARREIDGVEARRGLATLVVVGLGMAGTPGIAARTFAALAGAGINVIAIAQGSSELNVSLVVAARDAARAQRAVHAAFQLAKIGGGAAAGDGRTDVVLLGFGQIGRALAGMLAARGRTRPRVAITAVLDRTGYVLDARGFSARRLAGLARAKERGTPLARVPGGTVSTPAAALAVVGRHALANPVLVDVTADDTGSIIEGALASGLHAVLANKRPLTGTRGAYRRLLAAAAATGRELRHETTVGAGLPIIDTCYKLQEAGDRIDRIEGCPSGTLGFLFGELGRGRRFSHALRRAMDRGYTEPDPRDDLSGLDVARKALILGRLLGYPGELRDVRVESLVPDEARRLTLAQFLARLGEWDEPWARRVAAARRRGGVLRYRAIVTPRRIRVGLVVADAESAMAALRGTDNLFVFTTKRYRRSPIVITGPGAGPAVTAAGVLNDVLKVAGA
jgi:aspartokinase/homoserine dehydrogenase 1